MKLRSLYVLIFMASVVSDSIAQVQFDRFYQAGPVIKVITARMTVDSDLIDLNKSGAEVGYQFGAFFRINVENVYVQPSALLSKIKTQPVFLNYNNVRNFNPRADFEFNTLALPIDMGY